MSTRWFDETFYPEYGDSWDELALRERVLSLLRPGFKLIDVGAGRGVKGVLDFRGHCGHVLGVDPDEAVLRNPHVDEARVMSAPEFRIPCEDGSFDIAVSNSVIEHVSDSDVFFREVARVLRPGGWLLAKTPNKYHYVAAVAKATPHAFHEYYNRLRGRDQSDTFVTTYACNTRRALRRACQRHGLEVRRLEIVEGRPEYLRINPLTYTLGLFYERLVNASPRWQALRCVIFLEARKPQAPLDDPHPDD